MATKKKAILNPRTKEEIEAQIKKLQAELEKSSGTKPDFSTMKPGDKFDYCGNNWTLLEPNFTNANGTGALCISTKPWRDYVVFSKNGDNNYRMSNIRKLMLKKLAPKLEGKVILHYPDAIMENGKSADDEVYDDPCFLLSLREYIKYAEFIPYENYEDFWLRSAYRGGSLHTWLVHTSGYVYYYYAINALQCAPACIFIR